MSRLPKPTGYRMLVEPVKVSEKTKGGVFLPADTQHKEGLASITAKVLAMGPDCYQDKDRFPHGAYCEVGDYIMMQAYSGVRFEYEGEHYRIINDDSVQAVVKDPEGIVRV